MNCQRICNVIPEKKLCIVFETEKESFVYCRIYSDWERGSFHIPFSSETDSICIITMIFSLFFARLSVSAYPSTNENDHFFVFQKFTLLLSQNLFAAYFSWSICSFQTAFWYWLLFHFCCFSVVSLSFFYLKEHLWNLYNWFLIWHPTSHTPTASTCKITSRLGGYGDLRVNIGWVRLLPW